MRRHAKRIIYDIVGMVLIIVSPFLGWIPGPGGIPVFLAGLGLLAVHNDWAKNILIWARANAENLLESFFPNNKTIQLMHDIFGIALLAAAIFAFFSINGLFGYLLPIMLTSMGIFWLLYNRRRYKRFKNKH